MEKIALHYGASHNFVVLPLMSLTAIATIAYGSSGTEGTPTPRSPLSTTSAQPTATLVIPTAATAVVTDSDSSGISESSDTVVADQTDRLDSSFEWFIEEVGMGTKPAIVLAPDGTPHIGFMLEAIDGDDRIHISYVIQTGGSEVVVKYASHSANSKSWTIVEFDTLGEVFLRFRGCEGDHVNIDRERWQSVDCLFRRSEHQVGRIGW